jgi:hypothetical protein
MRVTLLTQPWQSMPSTFSSTVSIRAIIQFQHMPHRLKRFLLALALTLTVPLQGFAAVTAGLCMALEQPGMEHHQPDHDHGAHGHAPCGYCVDCCASIAMVSAAGLFTFPPAPAPIATAGTEPSGVQSHPLDRPPLLL